MTKQEIIDNAFYQLPDLDESYIEVLEDMHSAIVEKACEWLLENVRPYYKFSVESFRKAMEGEEKESRD